MHGVYEALQREGKIGPMRMEDGMLKERPFQEYPKWVVDANGKRVIVRDMKEEITVAGKVATAVPDELSPQREKLANELDALKAERTELDELKAQMRAQLDELATARAALQSGVAKQAAQQAPVSGSKYRQAAQSNVVADDPPKPSTMIPPVKTE